MANGKHRVETLPQASAWIAQHGGEIDEKWRHQDELNAELKLALGALGEKLDILNRRIAWATGAAMSLGAVLSLVAQSWRG